MRVRLLRSTSLNPPHHHPVSSQPPLPLKTTSSTLCVWMLYRIAQWPAPTPLLVSQLLTLRDRTGSQLSALWCCYILLLFEKKRKKLFFSFSFFFFGAVILFHANKQQHRVVKVYRVSECVSVCARLIFGCAKKKQMTMKQHERKEERERTRFLIQSSWCAHYMNNSS